MRNFIEKNFIVIAVAMTATAMVFPHAFTWAKAFLPVMLGLIMLGMGLTLELSDFSNVFKHGKALFIGIAAQYLIMPFLGYLVSRIFMLDEAALIGMMLLGACPGGTASNVVTYIARGNLPLSVSMTLVSTLAAPLMTPLIVEFYIGKSVPVPFWGMLINMCLIVMLPVASGILIRHFSPFSAKKLCPYMPSFSILMIVVVIAVVAALNCKMLESFPVIVICAAILHNISGLSLGYAAARLSGCSIKDSRTIAIEVGMQNSGLAATLAAKFFSVQSALPGAIFSLWHNISGITLAGYWSRNEGAERPEDERMASESAE
ncbi:MAG: hypothetical protein A2020_06440 [Lentisphaerae bacterium GWF2_45_14]|nr:MAG: hypothetical protein A2020_06440 [Lentisphaerae bacterium GWF2_45_14]